MGRFVDARLVLCKFAFSTINICTVLESIVNTPTAAIYHGYPSELGAYRSLSAHFCCPGIPFSVCYLVTFVGLNLFVLSRIEFILILPLPSIVSIHVDLKKVISRLLLTDPLPALRFSPAPETVSIAVSFFLNLHTVVLILSIR